MNAIFQHDPKRALRSRGCGDDGEGMLWRSKVEPTGFKIYVDGPLAGQVAEQARLMIQGRNAMVAVRLRIDRGKILEIEQLYDRNINDAAFPLLTTPRPGLVNDVPPSERASREVLIGAANSYFDALEGDDGKIGAFAQDCIRHENGYQTVNNPPPGGRMMPSPMLPKPNTEQGKAQLAFSMLTCEQQISAPSPQGGKTFSYMKHIRPQRALIIDEQKGLVGACFRCSFTTGPGGAHLRTPLQGCYRTLVTMETFGIRGGLIHEVEVFPFVTLPYGLGNGWTEGSGR